MGNTRAIDVDIIREQIRIGDAIVSGGRDPVSRLIQLGCLSRYSHVAVATGPDALTEAYDHALTPDESDEGIFDITVGDFVNRSNVHRIGIVRPLQVDKARLTEVAERFKQHSPGFPTVGMLFVGLCGVSGPLLRLLPGELRHRATLAQVRLAGDGVRKMHCAETVSRIYHGAGIPLRFPSPRLRLHIDSVIRDRPDQRWQGPDPVRRRAEPGRWPTGPGLAGAATAVAHGTTTMAEACRRRRRWRHDFDVADLIMPGDFLRAEPFHAPIEFVRTSAGWVRQR